MKFAPVSPERFGTLGEARAFMIDFVEGYNHTHRHTDVRLNTPADVYDGLAAGKAVERVATPAKARARNPERFSTNLDPKILVTPDAAWINKPTEAQEDEPKLAA